MSPTVWFVQAGSRGGAASFAGGQGISYSTSIAGKASENRVYRTLVTQDSNSVWSVHCLQLPFQERWLSNQGYSRKFDGNRYFKKSSTLEQILLSAQKWLYQKNRVEWIFLLKFCSKMMTKVLPFLPYWGAVPPNPAWDPSPLTLLQRFWEAKEMLTLQSAQRLRSPTQGPNILSSVHSRNEIFQLWHKASHVC